MGLILSAPCSKVTSSYNKYLLCTCTPDYTRLVVHIFYGYYSVSRVGCVIYIYIYIYIYKMIGVVVVGGGGVCVCVGGGGTCILGVCIVIGINIIPM